MPDNFKADPTVDQIERAARSVGWAAKNWRGVSPKVDSHLEGALRKLNHAIRRANDHRAKVAKAGIVAPTSTD